MRAIVFAVVLSALIPKQQPRLTANQASAVVERIVMYRRVVLQDTTKMDFCRVPEFWGTAGEFLGQGEAARMNRYATRGSCPRGAETLRRNVEIRRLTVQGDSIVVNSVTIREETRITESYVMVGAKSGDIFPIMYRVHLITMN